MFGIQLSIQVCVWVLTFSIHIQVVRFRYSDSGIQVWNSDLGIQDWVYRLADKYKALTFSIHIQGIQVHVFTFRHWYTGKSVHPNLNCKPEYPGM